MGAARSRRHTGRLVARAEGSGGLLCCLRLRVRGGCGWSGGPQWLVRGEWAWRRHTWLNGCPMPRHQGSAPCAHRAACQRMWARCGARPAHAMVETGGLTCLHRPTVGSPAPSAGDCGSLEMCTSAMGSPAPSAGAGLAAVRLHLAPAIPRCSLNKARRASAPRSARCQAPARGCTPPGISSHLCERARRAPCPSLSIDGPALLSLLDAPH